MNTGYTDVTTIPSGARHVSIMDDGTSGNNMFIGTYVIVSCYVSIYVCCNMSTSDLTYNYIIAAWVTVDNSVTSKVPM